eukprot:TRINITY_DN4753_c0_g1_i1.p1 TRINITY_DN4753_c0_g1~~TRINITY_DN4753_c0_g1_i1.p1  ORF type:complete len:547 (-),score=121.50 TRINITY_DN4753_c0_g1_i1:35-1675(-)
MNIRQNKSCNRPINIMGPLMIVIVILLVPATSFPDPIRFKDYFMYNRLHQCPTRGHQIPLPLSYFVPKGYYDSIPANQRLNPNGTYTDDAYVPECKKVVKAKNLNEYQFQTEEYLASTGLNIYDGSVWSIATALFGEFSETERYTQSILFESATCVFEDIKADAPCDGVISWGQCKDVNSTGKCGFCYGDGKNQDLKRENAWFFRMITDEYAVAGSVDKRCPEKKLEWTWNDYKPVLGENSWANLIGPLQTAYIQYGSAKGIPQSSTYLIIAINFVKSLEKMMIPSVKASYYAPHNTFSFDGMAEFQISTENNISLLAGLKMLLKIFQEKNIYLDMQPQIKKYISEITSYVKSAYRSDYGYFSQGGTYDFKSKKFAWVKEPYFAVDCQTWAMTVLGPQLVDQWFGEGASIKIWETTKKIGGYNYNPVDKKVEGVGFTDNLVDQVYSGEWSLGAMNMLKVFENYYNGTEAAIINGEHHHMRTALENQLVRQDSTAGKTFTGIKYTNKRYYIPFGWWANPLISTASTGWLVAYDKGFNPFYLGGSYIA